MADFTYVPMAGGGFGYTAFVRRLRRAGARLGLLADQKHRVRQTRDPRRGDASSRERLPLRGDTIHHSDAGSQYTAMHFTACAR